MPDTLARPLGFLSILLGVASIALLAVSVWGFRAGGWPWPQAYDLAGWGAWTAGAGVIAALAGLVVWLRRRRGGSGAVLLGLILSLPTSSVKGLPGTASSAPSSALRATSTTQAPFSVGVYDTV